MKSKIILTIILFLTLIIGCTTEKKVDEAPRVPEWAKTAVWYQIFPERFNNGDESNDPKLIDMEGAWPYVFPDDWQVHPWTSDWYKLQPYESSHSDNFYDVVNIRRYGGDLQGVIDKLDYLDELGISAIYLNPVFESPSLHKYDAAMYHHIDNNFGPSPERDRQIWAEENPGDPSTWKWTSADSLFLKLIDECHKRDMKIIVDGVFNHVGSTFWAFRDVVKNQDKSQYKDWFTIHAFDDPNTDENEFDYEGWFGVKDLPEIREDENGLTAGPAAHVKDIVQRWMDPNNDGDPSDGIDGWRLDVAEMVNIKFWKKFRTWAKDINPDAYITGEIWWDNWDENKMFNASPWLQGDAFDAVMNYRFAKALKKFISDEETQIDAEAFSDSLRSIYNDYHPDNLKVIMNLLDSHDVERIASTIVNPDRWYDHDNVPKNWNGFSIRAPNEIERRKQKLIVGLQMTLPGAPMIYYGDEAGMWGGDDPDCRKPMVWSEMEYETETTHPFGYDRPADEVRFDHDLFEWYKKLTTIRNENPVLALGDIQFEVMDNEKGFLLIKRVLNGNEIYLVVNNNDEAAKIKIDPGVLNAKSRHVFTELITGSEINFDYETKLELPSYGLAVLKK